MRALDERSRCATLEECDDGYRLTSRIPRDAALGSRLRAKELRRIVRRMIRHAKPISLVANEYEVSAVFDGSEPEANIRRLMNDLDRRVDEFRRERLHRRWSMNSLKSLPGNVAGGSRTGDCRSRAVDRSAGVGRPYSSHSIRPAN